MTAVAAAHGMGQPFLAAHKPGGLHILHNACAAFLFDKARIWPGFRLHAPVFVNDLDKFQPMPLAEQPVIMIMRRSNLECACAEATFNITIRDNWNFATQYRHEHAASN